MKTLFDLSDRVALVTGCSGGLGVQMAKALARRCIEAGAELLRFTTQGLREVESLKEIHAQVLTAVPLVADVHFNSEVADADYGYMGAGRDRISLYRGKECVLKNILQEEAVEQLLKLIENDRGAKA